MLAEQRISRATLWMSGAAIVRALLALGAQVLIASKFGAGNETDAYYMGISLPQIVGDFLVGGTLFSAFVPVFIRTWKQEGEEEAWRVASILASILFVVLAALAALYVLLAGPILHLIARGFDDSTHRTAVSIARVISPLFLLFGFSFLAAGLLQSYRHFTTTALSSLAFPLILLLSCVLFADRWGIGSLALGALVGAAAQCAAQWAVLLKSGRRVRLDLGWRHPALRRMMGIMAPIGVSVIALNLNLVYQRHLASLAEEGMVAALAFGWTFAAIPLFLVVPLTQAVFPTLSAHEAVGDRERLRDLLVRSLRMIGFVGIPAAAFLVGMREPLIRLLLERGQFDARDTALTSQAALYLGIAAIFLSCNQLMARSLYVTGNSRVTMTLNLLAVAVTLPLNPYLLGALGIGGLALARAAMFGIFFVGCLITAHRKVAPMPWAGLLIGWGKVVGLALVMMGLARETYFWMVGVALLPGPWGEGIGIAAGALVAVLVFLGGSTLLRMREVAEIWGARPWAGADAAKGEKGA